MRNRFSAFTTVLTFIVLFLGVLVVATKAGDACGFDWPYCDGKLYPDITNPLQVIEYTHRLITSMLGLVILINAILAFMRRKKGERAIAILAPLSLFLLLLQAGIGGLNVYLGTPPGFTTLDVIVSLLLFSSLVYLTTALSRKPITVITEAQMIQQRKLKKLFAPALTAMLFFYLEIALGAFFKHSAASEVLVGLHEKERLINSPKLAELIYYVHGIFGLIVVLFAFRLIVVALKERILVNASLLLVFLFIVETLVGFITRMTDLHVVSVSAHLLLGSVTMGVGTYIIAKAQLGDYYLIWDRKEGISIE